MFGLARKVAAVEKREADLKREMENMGELLAEVRRTRDVLSAQVESLLRERERDYEERSELRQLLGAITVQLQTAMSYRAGPATDTSRLATTQGVPQARAERNRRAPRAGNDVVGGLLGAARRGWSRIGRS